MMDDLAGTMMSFKDRMNCDYVIFTQVFEDNPFFLSSLIN